MIFKQSKIIWLIVIATLIRIVLAISIDLGNDEVYYLTYAQHLQWNYFDHPPMVALLIRLTTFNLFFSDAFFVRLGPILLAAINTYLMYLIGCKLKNTTTGLVAALLFTSSFYTSIIAGVFILPDAPQLFFWIICIYLLIDIVTATSNKMNYRLILFGFFAGLSIMSKIHGLFLWLGFGMYVLFYNRRLLFNKYLYLSVLISILIVSPILIWNIENHFITYTFHSNRVTLNRGINFNSFLREFIGGALYNNPFNYLLIVITLIGLYKNRFSIEPPIKRLLLLMSLPLVLVLIFISFFRETLPHWSGPAYVSLIVLTALFLSATGAKKYNFPKLVNAALFLTLVITFSGIVLINNFPGTIGSTQSESLGKGDVTLDMYQWDYFKLKFNTIYKLNLQNGKTATKFIINNKWFPAAHIDNYIAQPLHLSFVGLGKLEDIHTYAWLNNYRNKLNKGDDAYFVTFSNMYTDPNELYKDSFERINPPYVVTQYRNKIAARKMFVYLLESYKR
jgi:4-amino-4-deoxy-L-arabinose transferase-like glycosyltransferase